MKMILLAIVFMACAPLWVAGAGPENQLTQAPVCAGVDKATCEEKNRIQSNEEASLLQVNIGAHSQEDSMKKAGCVQEVKQGVSDSYSPVGRGPFGVGNFRPTTRAKAAALNPDTFHEGYVVPNRLVLISGAAEDLFHDVDSFWTIARLRTSEFAGEKLAVRQRHVRLAGCCPDDHLNVSEIYAYPNRTVHFEPVVFRDLLGAPGGSLGLKQEYFRKIRNRTFLQSFGPAEADEKTIKKSTFNMHLSNQGGAIPHSHRQTLNVCLQGAKRWIMVDPLDYPNDTVRVIFEQIDKMEAQRSKDIEFSYSSQDWFMKEATALLKSFGIPYYDFVQEQGDAVYIPDYWAHATLDLSRETMGVEFMGNFVHRGYRPPSTLRFNQYGEMSPDVFFADALEQARPMAWIHAPKTGGSFANTFLSSACPGVFSDHKVKTLQPGSGLLGVMEEIKGKGLCSGALSPFYESPPGHAGAGGLWQHEVKQKVVGFFRQPEQRHISGWLHGRHSAKDAKSIEAYRDRVRGCQVKVLVRTGGDPKRPMSGPCGDPAPVTQSEVEEAIRHVRHDFLFVGLTEKYALAVCLWHAMFGGKCESYEFVNSSPGKSRGGDEAILGLELKAFNLTAYNVNEHLGAWTDEADGQLYAAAVHRFNLDLAVWGVTEQKCAERICPGQAHQF